MRWQADNINFNVELFVETFRWDEIYVLKKDITRVGKPRALIATAAYRKNFSFRLKTHVVVSQRLASLGDEHSNFCRRAVINYHNPYKVAIRNVKSNIVESTYCLAISHIDSHWYNDRDFRLMLVANHVKKPEFSVGTDWVS